ncbi:hypothetical protein [Hoylesella enoeca]|nr:hypothetical protein [Hoylesella enoeca]
MKTIRLFQVSMLLALTLIAAGCANDEVAKNEQQGANGIPAGTTVFSGETRPSTTTRTAIVDHTKGGSAKVIWAATDKIWVKDNTNTWHESDAASFHELPNKAKAMFTLNGTYTGATHDVIYTNLPITGTPQVEIKSTQTQSAPNNFDHAGASGDCGVATATGGSGKYGFKLDHKASYLCLIPRTTDAIFQRCKLIKIEVSADNDIAGTYGISSAGLSASPISGASKEITLHTGAGFDLNTSTTDITKNGAYMVIAPGTHKLKIRYWLKDDVTNIEGTITKSIPAKQYEAGKIHDLTANLDTRAYDNKYYMWDAQKDCWYGHESAQPTANDETPPTTGHYPQSAATDPDRWHNQGALSPLQQASNSCKDCPNVNEMIWYVMKGEARADNDELYTLMGHLYKGNGVWLKKQSKIAEDEGVTIADIKAGYTEGGVTTDYRTSGESHHYSLPSNILPTAEECENYFFLPPLGMYQSAGGLGMLSFVGEKGCYFSSSPYHDAPSHAYYDLIFNYGTQIMISHFVGGYSLRAEPTLFK